MDYTTDTAVGTFDTPKDAGKGDPGTVRLWLSAIDLSSKEESDWRARGSKTIEIYRDSRNQNAGDADSYFREDRYNILYSNTETMAPALYNSTPIPDIRRRFSDPDPVGKVASQIMERAVSYSADQYDFDAQMRGAVKDLLLPGRAVSRVRYKPTMGQERERIPVIKNEAGYYRASDLGAAEDESKVKTDEQGTFVEGDPFDVVTYEEVCVEHVQWGDFRRGPGKTWAEVPWIAFRHYLTRAELEKLNPTVGKSITLDTSVNTGKPDDNKSQAPEPDIFKRALVWEIWDKGTKKVTFIAPSYDKGPLKVEDDPLGLDGFFPIPRPMYAVSVPETLVPVELYRLYREQAEELNDVCVRLTRLTRACRAVGAYAAGEGDNTMERLSSATDGDLVPSQQAMAFAAQGGIKGFVWERDIGTIAAVIDKLSLRQNVIKNNIFEIMGIADILRGSTMASETATAQNIKAQWGSLRLQQLQSEVQRYARDLYRLMAEVVANKFSRETLQAMTSIPLPLQIEVQTAQAMGQQVQGPTWEEIEPVLRNDAIRSFRIDIETDSTIQGDTQRAQQNLSQFVQGVGQFIQSVGPGVQAGAIPMSFVKTFLADASRTFKLSRSTQDAIENMPNEPPPQNDGQQQAEQVRAQAEQQKLQAEGQRTQAEMQRTQMEGQIAQQSAQMKIQEMQLAAAERAQEHQFKMIEMETAHRLRMEQLAAQTASKAFAA